MGIDIVDVMCCISGIVDGCVVDDDYLCDFGFGEYGLDCVCYCWVGVICGDDDVDWCWSFFVCDGFWFGIGYGIGCGIV